MKYAILFVAVALLAAILFVACSKSKNSNPSNSDPTVNTAANTLKLTEKDNGKNVEVRTGDIIRITLDSNITTGFSWEHADKVDADILKLDKNDYVSDPNPEELDGVGGRTVIVYHALKPGKAKIELSYMRPWESDSEFDEKFGVTVEVLEK